MLPIVIVEGNVTQDPDLKFTPSGQAVTTITVAAGVKKKDDAGNWVNGDTTFLNCVIWGEQAEQVVDTVTKGTAVTVRGQLKSRTVDRDGVKTTYFEVKADSIGYAIKKASKAVVKPVETIDPWATSSATEEAPF